MRLCIDIGNSKIKIGVYDPGRPQPEVWAFHGSDKRYSTGAIGRIMEEYSINAAILSHTRDYDPELTTLLKGLDLFIELNHNTHLPITNHYSTPETLGRDRLAAVCAANALYPGENALVIDAGTCITMDMIDSSGNYYGGSIHPGISMRFKALNNYTGKLPLVKRQEDVRLSGSSTVDAIASGVQYAVICEIGGMIGEYLDKMGELKVIITGGDMAFFVSRLKSKIFAHSDLVLTGLSKILDHNAEGLK